MKRLFNPMIQRREERETGVLQRKTTIKRIMEDKEEMKKSLEEQEKEFLNKKREYTKKVINFEIQEVARRQQEVEEKKQELGDMRRKNLLIQQKVEEQIGILVTELDKYRISHRNSEEQLDRDISGLNNTIAGVERLLAQHVEELGEDDNQLESWDQRIDSDEEEDGLALYPSLPTSSGSSVTGTIDDDKGLDDKYPILEEVRGSPTTTL